MPANQKYLMTSGWAKASKVIACIFGSLFASLFLHYTFAVFIDLPTVFATSVFSMFIVWALFMLLVYKIKSPLKAWGVIAAVIAIGTISIIFFK